MRRSVPKGRKPVEGVSAQEQARREAEFRKCKGTGPEDADACLYFLRNYWYIALDTEAGLGLFDVRPHQEQVIREWLKIQDTIALKARQVGFTTAGAAVATWETLFHEGQIVIFLSRTERDASRLLAQCKRGWRRLPDWMRERAPKPTSMSGGRPGTLTLLEWDNDSSIESLPSSEEPGRGLSPTRIFGDEWAFLMNPEEAWASVVPAKATRGRINVVSTANGENWFHRLWTTALTGTAPGGQLRHQFFSWDVVPHRNRAWYEERAKELPPALLAQEYPNSPEEAFRKSGNPVFDLEAVEKLVTVDPVFEGEIIPAARGSALELIPVPGGPYREWADPSDFTDPLKPTRFVLGVDVAEGLEHGDYSSVHVLKADTLDVVAAWHGKIDPDQLVGVCRAIGYRWHTALIGVEMNNHGLTTAVGLKKAGYPHLYYRRVFGKRRDAPTEALGWKTTAVTKNILINGLHQRIREDLPLNDEYTLGELRQYRVKYSERGAPMMSGQPHDDRVMSLAIAIQMCQVVQVPGYRPDNKPGPGTFGALKAEVGGWGTDKRQAGRRSKVGADNGMEPVRAGL